MARVSVMEELRTAPRWFRIAFGKPRVRHGVVWIVLAVCWSAVTFANGSINGWGYVIAAIWALVGTVMLTIAIRDLRTSRACVRASSVHRGLI